MEIKRLFLLFSFGILFMAEVSLSGAEGGEPFVRGRSRIVNLPDGHNVITSECIWKQPLLADDLKRVVHSAFQVINVKDGAAAIENPIHWLSVEEARTIIKFSNVLISCEIRLNKEQWESLEKELFSEKYFSKVVQTPSKERDPLVFYSSFILNALRAKNIEDAQKIMDEGIKQNISSLNRSLDRFYFLNPTEAERKFFDQFKVWENSSLINEEIKNVIFSPVYFGYPTTVEAYLQRQGGLFSDKCCGDVYESAIAILNSTEDESIIVIFGNTPALIGVALKHILKSTDRYGRRQVINFPFSGAPNKLRGFDVKALKIKDVLVTEERRNHLINRFKKYEIGPSASEDIKDKRIYFVDYILSGSGIAYALEELAKEFRDEKKEFPQCAVIALNEINIADKHFKGNEMISESSVSDGCEGMLLFPSKEDVHLEIPVKVCVCKSLNLLANIDDFWRYFPQYKPMFWSSEYDTKLLEAPLSEAAQLVEKVLCAKISVKMGDSTVDISEPAAEPK